MTTDTPATALAVTGVDSVMVDDPAVSESDDTVWDVSAALLERNDTVVDLPLQFDETPESVTEVTWNVWAVAS